MKSLFVAAAIGFGRCWKELFLTDVLYKFIAFIVLTPLVAILFQVIVAYSGNAVLADQDVLYFFLTPLGWICLIAVGALWLGIVALEQTACLAILASPTEKNLGVVRALQFATTNAWRVSRLTGLLVGATLLVLFPFLIVAGIVYALLLTDFDINYYLVERPPVFFFAAGIGGILGVAFLIVILRLVASWFFSLPLVVFEKMRPRAAIAESRKRAVGHLRTILLAVLAWLIAVGLVSSIATTITIAIGRFAIPRASGSLATLTVAIGGCLLVWSIVTLVVNLLSTTFFASLLWSGYRQLGAAGEIDTSGFGVGSNSVDRRPLRVTGMRIIVVSLLGIFLAAVVGVVVANNIRFEDDVQIIAHRGASSAAPENTMAAIRRAIQDQADWVEIDVQETADGEVVVFHDSDFMKLAGQNLKIWDAKMEDLEQIDIGSRFDPEFNSERVPTLAQVLAECKGKVGVNIELKYYGHDQQLEQRVIDVVEAAGVESEVMFMSLKMEAVKKFKSLRPNWNVGLLMSVSVGSVADIQADFLAVNAGFANQMFVRTAHHHHKKVYVWTVNDAVTMSTMIGRGVDGLITDDPALARSVIEQRRQMTPAERMVLHMANLFGVAGKVAEQ